MKKDFTQEFQPLPTHIIRYCWAESGLTQREIEVAQILFSGEKISAIRVQLGVSHNTVKTHLRKIYKKTGTTGQKDFILQTWQKSSLLSARFHFIL